MTVFLIAVTSVAGTLLSIFGAIGRRSRHAILRKLVAGYVELIRNTPFLVQLFFIFFGLPRLGIRL
ncbi:ABC transporter permease subunit, partial [Escherichia coli]|nr:ABC transporter permease subunit [Escherichia coli]